jgi:diadenosine tetraphosphatase ApaH/serine/threonine PP2A family protein phosphatase
LHPDGPKFDDGFSMSSVFNQHNVSVKEAAPWGISTLSERGFSDKNGNIHVTLLFNIFEWLPATVGQIAVGPDPWELIRDTLRPHDAYLYSAVSESDLNWLAIKGYSIFMDEPTILRLEAPLIIVGDLHGNYFDLIRIFVRFGFPNVANYLFLGDLVDRGPDALDIMVLILAFKVLFPDNIFLIRGNHECSIISSTYGFKEECQQKGRNYNSFLPLFDAIPIAAIISNKIFCVHGGVSPSLRSLDEIEAFKRPCDIPSVGLIHDLLWSDPEPSINYFGNSQRGGGCVYGRKALRAFLERFQFDLLVRAHEVVPDGFAFPFGQDEMGCVTVFSATNYFEGNSGCAMVIMDNLRYSFDTFKGLSQKQHEEYRQTDWNAFLDIGRNEKEFGTRYDD